MLAATEPRSLSLSATLEWAARRRTSLAGVKTWRDASRARARRRSSPAPSAGIGVDLAECFAQGRLRSHPHRALARRAARSRRTRLAGAHGVKATPIARRPRRHRRRREARRGDRARGLAVDVLVNNAGYGIAGAFDGSDLADAARHDRPQRPRARRADPHLLGAHARERARRRAQRRLHRRLPAGPADGDLLRVEGLRAVVLRGAVERSARAPACT